MQRFLKIFVLLMIALFLLVSGVNVALDRISRAPVQNFYSFYNEKGELTVAYNGDLSPYWNGRAFTPGYLHRVKGEATSLAPVTPS